MAGGEWLEQYIYDGTVDYGDVTYCKHNPLHPRLRFPLTNGNKKPLLTLTLVRLMLCGTIVVGFLLLFPGLMKVKIFFVGVLFTLLVNRFPSSLQIESLCNDEDDKSFMSAFISIFILVAMVVYTLITLFLVWGI